MSSGEITFPFGSQSPGSPVSLVNPEKTTPVDRRAIRGATGANGAPSGAKAGFATQNRKWLHIVLSLTGGTSVDWTLWTWDKNDQKWTPDSEVGTVTTDTADSPARSVVELAGVDRVYVELDTFVAAPSVDVWLASADER